MKTFSRHWYRVLMLVALFATLWPEGAGAASQEPPPEPAVAEEASRKSADAATPHAPVASSVLPAREAGAVQIRLQQATFDPLQTSPQLLSTLSQAAYAGDGMGYYLVQFEGPILSEWKEILDKEGVALHDYVPDFAFIVKMDQATANRVQSLKMVRWVGLYQPAYRLSNTLLPTVQSPQIGKLTQLVVRSFTGEPAADLVKEFAGLKATILSQSRDTGGGTIFQVELPEAAVANVARLSGVAWVQPKYAPVLYNAIARSSAAMNKDAVENTLGLYGENQIVVVGDTGFSTGNAATMHQDFRGHFYKGSWGSGSCGTWADPDSHGTHVAGSVLGSGVMDGAVTTTHSYAGTNAGIAPEALLWGWAFCINNSWDGLPDAPYDDYYGVMYNDDPRVRVNTNSWGSNAPHGTYDTFSRDTDRFIWDHPDMVVLVAAGNDGIDANSDGIVDVDSMGIPAGSKNIITVGASENYRLTGGYNPGGDCQTWNGCWGSDYPANPVRDDRLSDDPSGMVAFSSRGPVDDGRLKPDVVAPGSNIVSTRDDSGTGWGVYDANYIYMGGTSMATPLTAGAAAIVREFYSDTYGLNPTAALVKATFINGAFDMTPGQYRDSVPDGSKDDVIRRADINQGWGRVDLATSLIYTAPRQLWYKEHAGLATGEEYALVFNVTDTQSPFRVSLVWSDQPGLEAAHGALINDLDLRVIAPGGVVYYGNDIISDGLLDGDMDRVNNVEGVDLAPGVAAYTVIVRGHNIPNGPQPFALVVSGDLGSTGTPGALKGVVSDAGTSVGIANARIEAALTPAGTPNFAMTTGDGAYRTTLAAGTYNVTASAYGYAPQTVTGVAIANGVTTTQDFALSPAPSYILTGTVTDAGTGWALYASVEIEPDGYPATTVWTNPWTGVYSVTIPGGYTHTLTVEPWSGIPGYVGQSRQVNVSANRYDENFALAADAATCNAPGYARVGLNEGFESATFPPTGWVRFRGANGLGTAQDWQRTITAYAGSGAAYVQYENVTGGLAQDWLVTPRVRPTAGNSLLSFYMRQGYTSDYDTTYTIRVSTNSQTTHADFTTVQTYAETDFGITYQQFTVDLSAYVGQDIYIAFVMEQDNGDNWYLDNVRMAACAAPTGGLIAGSVYDRNTNAALTGATVSNEDGYGRTTAATPGDPTISDSFYALYSPSGSKTLSATLSGYTSSVADGLPVVAGKTGGQDFFLDAGHIIANPVILSAWLKPGGSTAKSFTLTNDGGVTAAYNLIEKYPQPPVNEGFEGGVVPPTGWTEQIQNASYNWKILAAGVHTGAYSADVEYDPAPADQNEWLLSPIYTATIGSLSFWSAGSTYWCRDTYDNCDLGVYIVFGAVGGGDDVFIGNAEDSWSGNFIWTQSTFDLTPHLTGGGFRIGFNYVGNDGAQVVLDDIHLELESDIPWLSKTPTTGSLAASGGAQTVQATFNATGLTAGTYNGTLRVATNTPYPPQDMPTRLTVGAEFISQQTGAWSGSAWASGTPSANDWVTVTTGHTVTVDNATAACYGLTIMPGGALVIPAGNTLTVESAVQNNGTLRQTKSIPGAGDVDFHLRASGGAVSYYSLLFEALGYNMGNTTVDVHGAVINGTGTLNQTAARWFDITPQNALTGIPTTFYYADGELNGNVADTLDVYHYQGSGQWNLMTTLARGGSGTARSVTAEIGPDFSPFVLKSPDAPTTVRTNGISAVSGGMLAFGMGLFALGGAAASRRKRR